jgi:tRNA dimethylallyltransferase
LPIIIGGSNLYIDALIYNYDLSATKRDDKYDNLTIPELFSLLSSKDEQLANKIGNNKVRLVRALQILDQDKSLVKKNQPIYDYKIITCNYHTRKVLMDVVNNNVDKMLKNGWIDEVKNLLKAHGSEKLLRTNAFKALGYKDIVTSITSNTKLDIDKIKTNSRHYAKRQIT